MTTKKKLAAWLLTLAALPAAAQTVYRCGNEYSQKPCPDARAVALDETKPAAADARAADAQAQRNAKLADRLEKDRLAEEKRVAGPSMVVTGQKPVQAAAVAASGAGKKKEKGKGKAKDGKPGQFTATAPAKPSGATPLQKKSG
jgi:hypothetical protein